MLAWCLRARVPAILMSDSQEIDEKRTPLKEFAKSRLVRLFDGGFVAGSRHAGYLRKLGFGDRPMVLKYDVVDNKHFAPRAPCGPRAKIVCCARLVAKKNLPGLIDAYRGFLDRLGDEAESAADLVIAGDGPMRTAIEAHVTRLGVSRRVSMIGHVDYVDMPAVYHSALALILPSTTEQWGLVVNEAMAAGCAVFVSERAGCAPDLVRDGENGFTFDPHDPYQLAELLLWSHRHRDDVERMGRRSLSLISEYTVQHHTENALQVAKEVCLREYAPKDAIGQSLLASLLGPMPEERRPSQPRN
jgi:glycosyltransferase involved in cell wall biosynthesis